MRLYFRSNLLLLAPLVFAAFGTDGLAGAVEPTLKIGTAAGAFVVGDKSAKLAFAATFTDQKDDRKPTVLVLSEKEVPVSTFKDGSDFSGWRREHKVMGLAFWMDAKNEIFRIEYYDGGLFPTSAFGLFDVKITRAAGSLRGTAKSKEAAAKLHDPVTLDATFNAALK